MTEEKVLIKPTLYYIRSPDISYIDARGVRREKPEAVYVTAPEEDRGVITREPKRSDGNGQKWLVQKTDETVDGDVIYEISRFDTVPDFIDNPAPAFCVFDPVDNGTKIRCVNLKKLKRENEENEKKNPEKVIKYMDKWKLIHADGNRFNFVPVRGEGRNYFVDSLADAGEGASQAYPEGIGLDLWLAEEKWIRTGGLKSRAWTFEAVYQ